MNKIMLIGNLTRDPETRSTPTGITVCTFDIAVTRRFASQNGEKQTDYFRINAWRQLGDACSRYLTKGKKVAVLGEMQARTYQANDGSTRVSLDVQADEVEFLTPRQQAAGPAHADPPPEMAGFEDINEDELPF